MPQSCRTCGQNIGACECESMNRDWETLEELQKRTGRSLPEPTTDAMRAGRALGVDFAYVPGDPFW